MTTGHLHQLARPSRAAGLWWLAAALVVVVTLTAGWLQHRQSRVPLYLSTLAVGRDGSVVEVKPGDEGQLIAGTRVLRDTPDAASQVRRQQDWLAAGTVPSVPELGDTTLVRDALLDLHLLAQPGGVAVAGAPPPWNNVWPRDSAFVAAALARTGHHGDAEHVLNFLTRVQGHDGTFQARYRTDGSLVPDDRGSQLDGVGWSLWALEVVAGTVPRSERADYVRSHRRLLDASSAAIGNALDPDSHLPPPSSDYWEKPSEDRLSLATAAVLLAGSESAGRLYRTIGATRAAETNTSRAIDLRTAISTRFGPDGYPRYLGGPARSVDLGASFLLPPFVREHPADVVDAWRRSASEMARPAGGLAPGGGWRPDGISWTPTTATYALVAAALGDRESAVHYLRWLDVHRTAGGSIPEKVLADGSPASVAPLGWSAAAVILAAAELTAG
ncbi:hypothetical protein GCM10009841_21600 [Microlunatus panaciterrae]|uniref:GH15 family glucan-1,4-alpha-glucosidase n=1 Tax=Microlunatus panaciterrae TaxID=400768 RepID=A0ABS2RNY4_9ACTN|nr:hypothetical protein [Microlunatus panaciterrae]MBM7800714.1 GH15 family glucan-1,4-alpha-glucosidase [Microlunatus panaciterrae]